MICMFYETLSISAVHYLCSQLWQAQDIQMKFIDKKTIKELIISYGYCFIYPLLLSSQQKLIKSNSQTISADHTYKYVKQ